jgi:cytochrome c oxidase subunit 3
MSTAARPHHRQFGAIILVAGIVLFALSILLFAHPGSFAGPLTSAVTNLGWGIPAAGLLLLTLALALFAREILASRGVAAKASQLASARTAVLLFIVSEASLFAALFAAYLYFALGSGFVDGGLWPPAGLSRPQPWGTPLLGTVLLLVSGASAVAAHHFFLDNKSKSAEAALLAAILLGMAFLVLQIREFALSSFAYQDGVYPSVFFMATGLHGLHVLVGTVLLAMALLRLRAGHFTAVSHFGLEAPIWYWHFVDGVWILLFAIFYVAAA